MIHFENYKTFSAGQGFVGVMCRPAGGPAASTLRWFATDCPNCKAKLIGRKAKCIDGRAGEVAEVSRSGMFIRVGGELHIVNWRDFDLEWSPA